MVNTADIHLKLDCLEGIDSIFDLSRYIISENLFVKETVGIKHLGIHLILAIIYIPQNLSLS